MSIKKILFFVGILCFACVGFFFLFGKKNSESSVRFVGRYYTDSELDKINFPSEIKFPYYEDFQHQCLLNKKFKTVSLRGDYNYKSKYLTLEEYSDGNQRFHFFLDSNDPFLPKDSKDKMKNQLKNTISGSLEKDFSTEFSFNLQTSDVANTCVFITKFNVSLPSQVCTLMEVFVQGDEVFVKFKDIDENLPLTDAVSKNLVKVGIKRLGKYKFGTEAKIKIECVNRKMTATYYGNYESYTLSEKIPLDTAVFSVFGLAPSERNDVFYEMFVSDYKMIYE